MAEYTEVIKQFKRMCESTTGFKCSRGECPVMGYAFGCENISQCRKIALEHPNEFEEKVMSWAAEHPEPVYPTWAEWLESMHVITVTPIEGCMIKKVLPAFYMFSQIPADIAQKLGIEPKEG